MTRASELQALNNNGSRPKNSICSEVMPTIAMLLYVSMLNFTTDFNINQLLVNSN